MSTQESHGGGHAALPALLPRRNAAEQRKLDAALIELFEKRISFNQLIGHRVVSLAPGAERIVWDMRPELVGHYLHGRLHGGVISASLDVIGSLALLVAVCEKYAHEDADHVMARFARMGTVDLRIDYLRQGLGRHFEATAEVTRLGGRVGSTLMRLENDAGLLIATGAATYVVA